MAKDIDYEFANRDIDEIIKAARNAPGVTIDARMALELLIGKLTHGKGFYQWAHLEGAWFVRVPNGNRADTEEWLRSEPPEIVHICAPLKFLNAVETMANKEESAHHVGYARTNDDDYSVTCVRCKFKTSEEAAKRGLVQVKLMLLSKKV